MSDTFHLREINRVQKGNSDQVAVYEIIACEAIFAYLYLNSATYSLVWTGRQDFQFDGRQPYTFVEYQFSHLPPSAIERLEIILPKRLPQSEVATRMLHFRFNRAQANLLLVDETDQSLVEYDLLKNEQHRMEYVEGLRQPDYVSRISFARYDSEIETRAGHYACCFTAEKPRHGAAEGWEFAIKTPRKLLLTERALKWVVRNHHAEGLMHHLDFKKSQDALREVLNPQTESVFS